MKIEYLTFASGSSQESDRLHLPVAPVTVFVGPNYSGKSRAIEEIAHKIAHGGLTGNVVLHDVGVKPISDEEADSILSELELKPNLGEALQPGHKVYGYRGARNQLPTEYFKKVLLDPKLNLGGFAQWYSQSRVLSLNGANRISLANDQAGGDLQGEPTSSFQSIFRDDELRSRLSKIVHDAFGLYLAVDPTYLGHLRLRLSSTPPPSAEVERGLTSESVAFHGEATHIVSTSDGAKAFVGIMSEVMAGNPDILLIDEPEAFLHPSLSFLLGREIAHQVGASNKQMFVSTHSPNFVMGCLNSGVGVNIVRLTYRNGVATARLLPGDELRRMIRNPLLRSTGVIGALFYESVIVTEGDPDRAFYQEINERLLRDGNGRGIPNAIFLNAQNKQTIPTIIAPLRKLGIPAAAIYDIDFIKDGGSTATSFLRAAGIPDISQSSLTIMRASVLKALQEVEPDFKRLGGIELLNGPEKQAAIDYLDQLAAYGAFLVPHGELEQWLPELKVRGHGPSWLIPIFEKLGEDPSTADYIRPSDDDVWAFLDRIRGWLLDPARKGIPI